MTPHRPIRVGWLRWYLHFPGGYLSGAQMLLLLGWWGLLIGSAAVAPVRAVFIRTGPCVGSAPCPCAAQFSLQLFVFGTTGRTVTGTALAIRHHARSLECREWLSVLGLCYHFGLPLEHHEFPAMAVGFSCHASGAFALQRRIPRAPLAGPIKLPIRVIYRKRFFMPASGCDRLERAETGHRGAGSTRAYGARSPH